MVKGTVITCENGHPIATFARDVRDGDSMDSTLDLEDWKVPEPRRGTPVDTLLCPICGALWARTPEWHVISVHTDSGWTA